MVRIQGPSEYDRLDALVHELVARHGFHVVETGWTRKTYDVFMPTVNGRPGAPVARVESFATTNGEIVVFDDRALALANDLGAALEREFGVPEATVVRRPR